MASIAEMLGITRERVRQIANREGVAQRTSPVGFDPLKVVTILRRRETTSYMAVATELGAPKAHVTHTVAWLGMQSAIARLFRWRKGAEKRARIARAIAAYRAKKAELGRAPTFPELSGCGVSLVAAFGRNYWSTLRRLAGDEDAVTQIRKVRYHGELRATILRLAAREQGCTVREVQRRVRTSASSINQTIAHLKKAGVPLRIDRLPGHGTPRRYFLDK